MKMRNILTYAGSIAISFLAGFIGSLATRPNIPTWYADLDKPAFIPPNYVFGPVWSILYVLTGIALALVILAPSTLSKKNAYAWFGIQLALNTVWSLVFFGARTPWAGVIIILLLISSIIMAARAFYDHSKLAAWILAPYLAWVCFATYLTIGVAVLNS